MVGPSGGRENQADEGVLNQLEAMDRGLRKTGKE
jgi:hypothetical protein